MSNTHKTTPARTASQIAIDDNAITILNLNSTISLLSSSARLSPRIAEKYQASPAVLKVLKASQEYIAKLEAELLPFPE